MKAIAWTLCMAAVLSAGPAFAQGSPPTIPGGPYGENESLAALRSYGQLVHAVQQSIATSQGVATFHWAPWTSNTGRGVPYVVIGTGPTAALIISQQHGDEMETSDSAVALIRTLVNNSTASKLIRERLTVVVVPRVNVDGFDAPISDAAGRTPPWRQNYDPRFTANPLPAFYQRGRGFDINRYHAFRPECPLDNPNFPNFTTVDGVRSCEQPSPDNMDPTRGNPVPEAKNVRWLYDRFNPVVALDMHHQGTRVHDGKMVTASTLWPTALLTAQRLHSDTDDALGRFNRGVDMAKRVVVVIAQTLAQYPYADLSRYPGGTEPGISRNAYGLLGSGSVLLELRGGIGTKSGGYIQKIGYHASMAIVEELAKSADLAHIDPGLAELLVIPANSVPPRPADEEAMVDDVDDHHLGN